MKKAYIIILLFLISILCPTITKADVIAYISKEEYFANLKENFGHNFSGSCSYVSLEMLLLYYDSFLNDDIVPEQYEVKTSNKSISPGSLNDKDLYNSDIATYVEHIESLKEKSLHAKLISYQIEYLRENNITVTESNISINTERRIEILECYLEDVCSLTRDTDYNIISQNLSNLNNPESYVINQINNYDIALVGLDSIDRSISHAAIAYEYTNDKVYINYGYHSGSVNTSREDLTVERSDGSITEYMYTNAMSISFNISHKHSDSYNINYNYKIHKTYCPCGYYKECNHIFGIEGNTGICKYCGNNAEISFTPIIISDPGTNTPCGTYVNLYGGSDRGNDIVPGFTRLLYFDYSSPSLSRLDYDWYSSDESKATVTKYGTVMGVSRGEVLIYAFLKDDPRKVGVFTMNVNPDYSGERYYLEMTTDTRPDASQNGTEVTVLNQQSGLFTIHSGYSRALCFASDNVYPSMKDFIWVASSGVTINENGMVTAEEVQTETNAVVEGWHKNNNNVRIRVVFTILPMN